MQKHRLIFAFDSYIHRHGAILMIMREYFLSHRFSWLDQISKYDIAAALPLPMELGDRQPSRFFRSWSFLSQILELPTSQLHGEIGLTDLKAKLFEMAGMGMVSCNARLNLKENYRFHPKINNFLGYSFIQILLGVNSNDSITANQLNFV